MNEIISATGESLWRASLIVLPLYLAFRYRREILSVLTRCNDALAGENENDFSENVIHRWFGGLLFHLVSIYTLLWLTMTLSACGPAGFIKYGSRTFWGVGWGLIDGLSSWRGSIGFLGVFCAIVFGLLGDFHYHRKLILGCVAVCGVLMGFRTGVDLY